MKFRQTIFVPDYVEHMHKPENEVIVYHVSDEVKFPTYALFAGKHITDKVVQIKANPVFTGIWIITSVRVGRVGPVYIHDMNVHKIILVSSSQ